MYKSLFAPGVQQQVLFSKCLYTYTICKQLLHTFMWNTCPCVGGYLLVNVNMLNRKHITFQMKTCATEPIKQERTRESEITEREHKLCLLPRTISVITMNIINFTLTSGTRLQIISIVCQYTTVAEIPPLWSGYLITSQVNMYMCW